MRRLLVGALLILVPCAASAACPGDCGGNGVVSIDELVTAVRIALAQAPLTACANADAGGDGRVNVDDLVRAVNAALGGCISTPTATVSAAPSAEATATPSASPEPTNGATPSASTAPSDTPTIVMPATATPSATSEATAAATGVTATATPPLGGSPTSIPTRTSAQSPTRTISPSVTPISTHTHTPTPSPSPTPTGGPLGTRRFSLNPTDSAFVSVLAADAQFRVPGFTGYLDLQAGAPDAQGRAKIKVTGSSTYLYLKSGMDLICIKPLVSAEDVGVVDCDGGTNPGITIQQNHRIGIVGTDGFEAEHCTAAGGSVETGNLPHLEVCNGPLTVAPSANADSGPGAVAINGLLATVTFEVGEQCTGNGDGFTDVLPLISRDVRTEILHANNADATLVYDNPGESFSCPLWTQENGPGQLILSFPTLHGTINNADVINVFLFDD